MDKPMERKKISEIVELKLKNAGLSLQVIRLQADLITVERDRLLSMEFERLGCKPRDWQLDEKTWELIANSKAVVTK